MVLFRADETSLLDDLDIHFLRNGVSLDIKLKTHQSLPYDLSIVVTLLFTFTSMCRGLFS